MVKSVRLLALGAIVEVACGGSGSSYALYVGTDEGGVFTANSSDGSAGPCGASVISEGTVTVWDLCKDGGASVIARTAVDAAVDAPTRGADAGSPLEFWQPTPAAWTGITVGLREGGKVYWASWTSAASGSVTGSLSPPSGTIDLVYTGDVSGAQTTTGGDSWTPAAAYVSATVPDPPPGPGIIELAGGPDTRDTVTFSRPVTNPVVAVVSLGTGYANLTASLLFSAPIAVLSTGVPGYVGNGNFIETDGGVAGTEAQGVVEVQGTF